MSEFDTTRWSVVLAAQDSQTAESRDAMEMLCRSYWKPLHVYVQARGYSAEDAQDLVQEFFAHVLERKTFRHADAARGRFRSFLLASLRNFLSDERDRAAALKRGGGVGHLRMDFAGDDPFDVATTAKSPDESYERQWALSVLQLALDRLKGEFVKAGKGHEFDTLSGYITGDTAARYSELAVTLGIDEQTARVRVHRVRKRFAACTREVIARTLGDEENAEAELQYLLSVL